LAHARIEGLRIDDLPIRQSTIPEERYKCPDQRQYMASPGKPLVSNGKIGISYYTEALDQSGMSRTSNHWGKLPNGNWTLNLSPQEIWEVVPCIKKAPALVHGVQLTIQCSVYLKGYQRSELSTNLGACPTKMVGSGLLRKNQ